MSTRSEAWRAQLQEYRQRVQSARERDYTLWLRGYCEASGCPAREFDLFVKDLDAELLARLEQRWLRCPICGTTAVSLHHVQTYEEHEAEEDRLARSRVNWQRYRRDHPHELGIPLGAFLDDTLP